jgi:nitrogen fixation protein NifB
MNFKEHPCFSENARHTTGRIHLPVAPKCNIQCNFCDRKYDCVNESRPGVTSSILTPRQAADYLEKVMEKIPAIAVAGIAGPGDPLANAEETLETFRRVRERFPDLHLCMATNGLELETYADDIASIGVNHVTVTVNAVDPVIAGCIYSWVRFNKRPRRGVEGAEILLNNQQRGIEKLKKSDTIVKINTVVISGINDRHITDISRKMSQLGADVHNCIPLYNVEGTLLEGIPSVTAADMKNIRDEASFYLKQISHCKRCRADAVGMLGESNSDEIVKLLSDASEWKYDSERKHVAVASMEGIFVNQHLGEASEMWIFKSLNGRIELLEKRKTPSAGGGSERWSEMADLLHDCRAVLVSGSGRSPVNVLESKGIRVITMEGFAEEAMNPIFSGKNVPSILLRTPGKCGAASSCGGTGTGCG